MKGRVLSLSIGVAVLLFVIIRCNAMKPYDIREEMNQRGNIGRLYIPDVGVNVALFRASVFGDAQKVVDAKDSAAYMDDGIESYNQILIGDHMQQGFYAIKNAIPDLTYAFINYGTHSTQYICRANFKGYNIVDDLVDMNGVSISRMNNNGICMYTCNVDDTITITLWEEK